MMKHAVATTSILFLVRDVVAPVKTHSGAPAPMAFARAPRTTRATESARLTQSLSPATAHLRIPKTTIGMAWMWNTRRV
jgi:hypothetical protein